MAQNFSLKDQLFNADKVGYLSDLFSAASPAFDGREFQGQVMGRLLDLELKDRIAWIADCLSQAVPGDIKQIAPVVLQALPEPLDPTLGDNDFGDFIFAPLGDWVVSCGLDSPDLSLTVLEQITQRFSMEWAIRPFLNHWPDLVLERMADWTGHDNYHVRRLVSEGTRPKLPWGKAVTLNDAQTLPLLDRLYADPTRYVTRSVANHLNDITKKSPDIVLGRLTAWRAEGRQTQPEVTWMTSHALRGLVKAGHPGAMKMLGFDPDAEMQVDVVVSGEARIDGALEFQVTLNADPNTPVLVDYVVHFRRPCGKVSAKVHKLKQAVVGSDELVLSKRHKLKGDATTFKLVPGAHQLDIQVNGKLRAGVPFELLG
ncbi:MAG: hypothetical protein AAF496_14515 [Pseudomonadota bacterium]